MSDEKRKERKICGAKKKDGTPCKGQPMANGRCRIHGGLTPSGIASPHFQHGKYSKALPTRMLDKYNQIIEDPEILALRDEIAVCDARIEDLLGRVDTGEAGRIWTELRAAYHALMRARREEDTAAAADALTDIGRLIGRGQADYAAWDEVGDWFERRRKLAETETKRLTAMQATITADKAIALLGAVGSVIKRHVQDPAALKSIAQELRVLANRPEFETASVREPMTVDGEVKSNG